MPALRPFLVASALSLAACSSVAAPDGGGGGATIADGSSFSMRPGQAVTLADRSILRYERLVGDSRCPPDVQCVWAGDAELAFSWRGDSGSSRFSLHTGTGENNHALDGRTLTLVSVARGPAPEAQLRVDR